MRVTLFGIVLAFVMCTAHAQEFNLNPTAETIEIIFDHPKGTKSWSDPYVRDFDIVVTNLLNATRSVNINPSSNDEAFIRLTSSQPTLTVPPLGSNSVKITVKIVDRAADGGVYTGRIRVTSGSHSEDVQVRVKTIWPPPTLSLSGNVNFGDVSTGTSYRRSFILREELGFYTANNVQVKLNPDGPIHSVTTSPTSFPLIDGKGKTINFGFTVNERNIVPGTYRPRIDIISTNRAYLMDNNLRYSIPKPIIEVSKPRNKIIFDYGKPGTSDQEITITETGGKTPVESTTISSKTLGKEIRGVREEYVHTSWFNFPTRIDYIPPGGSESIRIKLTKPDDAPVGNYLWEGIIQTKYAGDEPIQISFAVIPPGVRELLNDVMRLKNEPFITRYPHMEKVREATESLLKREFFEYGMVDVEHITLLTTTVVRFLNSMSAAYGQFEKNSYNAAYEEIKTSKEEINKMNSIPLHQKYSQEDSGIKESAYAGWLDFSRVVISGLESNASEFENLSNPDASYYESRNVHEKIKDICSWMNDSRCVEEQNTRILELNEIMKQLIAEAHELENQVQAIHSDVQNHTWGFFGMRVISNPLHIVTIWEQYNEMIEMSIDISRKYQLCGELIEFERTQEKLAALEKVSMGFKIVSSIYIIFWGYIVIQIILKSISGFLRYRADRNDMRLIKIVQLEGI